MFDDDLELPAFVAEPVFEESPRRPPMNSCGLPLLSNSTMDRWREEAERREHQKKLAREEMKAREEKTSRLHADAAAFNDPARGFSSLEHEVLGKLVVMLRREWRAELAALKTELLEKIGELPK